MPFFLIQTLGIEVTILPGSQTQMHSVTFLYYLNSIQFVKKDLIQRIVLKNSKQEVQKYILSKSKINVLRRLLKKVILILSALGRKDSNLRIPGPKPVALPLGHAPFQFLFGINKD